MKKAAFTLLELLIVIAIIAIMTSILLPALTKAREQGRSIVCRGNLKQLGTIFYLYHDTYGVMPATLNYDVSPNKYWTQYLYDANFLKTKYNDPFPRAFNCATLQCPTDTDITASANCWSYGMNYLLAVRMGVTPATANHANRKSTFINPAKISKASLRVLLGDASDIRYGFWETPYDIASYCNFRHSSGSNILWLDAHASYVKAPLADYRIASGQDE